MEPNLSFRRFDFEHSKLKIDKNGGSVTTPWGNEGDFLNFNFPFLSLYKRTP